LDVGRLVFGKQVLDLQDVLSAQKRAEGHGRTGTTGRLASGRRAAAKR
jgi:hypothetical protein